MRKRRVQTPPIKCCWKGHEWRNSYGYMFYVQRVTNYREGPNAFHDVIRTYLGLPRIRFHVPGNIMVHFDCFR